MGWTFGKVTVTELPGMVVVAGSFICACGRQEWFSYPIYYPLADYRQLSADLDVAAKLRENGSFSRLHLLDDGYTADEVDLMLANGDDFDKREGAMRAGRAAGVKPWGARS